MRVWVYTCSVTAECVVCVQQRACGWFAWGDSVDLVMSVLTRVWAFTCSVTAECVVRV